VIKIVHHTGDVSADTRVMGLDHLPYACNSTGVPYDVAIAVRAGFAFNVPEFDCRQTEWEEETHAAHSYRNA
jgi:hypothetical protein